MSSPSSTRSLEISLPAFSLRRSADGAWLLTVQITPADQAQLDAARLSSRDLCCRAQHTLGLTAIGSRIYADRSAVGVYTGDISSAWLGEPRILLDGPATLWFIAHAAPDTIRAIIHAAIRALHDPQHEPGVGERAP